VTNNVTTLYENGQTQADSKNYTGAYTLYQRALPINPKDVQVLSDLGRVLYNLQNNTGALHSLNKALTIDPTSVYALEQKGFVLSRMGDYKEALDSFDKALKLNPSNYQTLNNKGITLINLGDYRQAIATFDTALNTKVNGGVDIYSFPDASVTLFNKALALLRLGQQNHDIGDIDAAMESVDKALYYNADDKHAQGLRQSLKDLLAWQVGAGAGEDTAGFEQAMQGIPLGYHHTEQFLTGYKQGQFVKRQQSEAENN
jgi:tetratricopeptide (TPR) repeat protein